MKLITVKVSDDTCPDSQIAYLGDQIPEKTRNSVEFPIIFSRIKATIEDFSEKARALARAGTTVQITRDYELPGTTVRIILEYPGKTGILQKISTFLKKSNHMPVGQD